MKDGLVNTIEDTIMNCIQKKLRNPRNVAILLISVAVVLCLPENEKKEM